MRSSKLRHIIVGLSQHSNETLLRVDRLCHDRLFTEEDLPIFFNVNCSDKATDNLTLVENITFPAECLNKGIESTAQLINSTLGNSICENIKGIFPNMRRTYSEGFDVFFNVFERHVAQHCQAGNIFHIVANLASAESSGLLFGLIRSMSRHYPDVRLNAYILMPVSSAREHENAQIYASLLECNQLKSMGATLFMYPFSDKKTEKEMVVACSHQIYYNVTINIPSGIQNSLNDENHIFTQIRNIALSADIHKMRMSLCRQSAYQIVNQMFYSENEEHDHDTPLWLDKLFEDKKWLLHPDFLSMDQDVNMPHSVPKFSTVEHEWSHRTQHFVSGLDRKELDWRDQVEEIYISLRDVAQRAFRGKGIDLFYAMNESGISAIAETSVGKIETALIEDWKQKNYPIQIFLQWLQKAIEIVDTKLLMYRNSDQQHRHDYETLSQEFDEIVAQWDEGKKSERKKIQKEHPIEEMASKLERYYVADCHIRTDVFACRILNNVVSMLNDVKNHLSESISEAQANIAQTLPKTSTLSAQSILSTYRETDFRIAVDTNFLSIVPKNFHQAEVSLRPAIRQMVMDRIDSGRGISGIIDAFNANHIVNDVSHSLLLHHPYFNNQSEELSGLFFWQTISAFLGNESTQHINPIITQWNQQRIPNCIYGSAWLIPTCPFGQNVLDKIIDACQKHDSDSSIMININMLQDNLHYQEQRCLSISELPNIQALKQAYDDAIFSENGAHLSLLYHTYGNQPFFDYEGGGNSDKPIEIAEPDVVRRKLLLGEIHGIISEEKVNNQNSIFLSAYGSKIPLGKSFTDVLSNLSELKHRLLNLAVDNIPANNGIDPNSNEILNKRLAKIKISCLNGKTDLRKASWEEAGNFMPWARQVEKISREFKLK